MNVVSKITLSQVHFKFFVKKCINIYIVVVGDTRYGERDEKNEIKIIKWMKKIKISKKTQKKMAAKKMIRPSAIFSVLL